MRKANWSFTANNYLETFEVRRRNAIFISWCLFGAAVLTLVVTAHFPLARVPELPSSEAWSHATTSSSGFYLDVGEQGSCIISAELEVNAAKGVDTKSQKAACSYERRTPAGYLADGAGIMLVPALQLALMHTQFGARRELRALKEVFVYGVLGIWGVATFIAMHRTTVVLEVLKVDNGWSSPTVVVDWATNMTEQLFIIGVGAFGGAVLGLGASMLEKGVGRTQGF